MAESINSLEELGTVAKTEAAAPVHVQKLDAQGRAYATGKRKDAVARVWVKPGTGKITVNDKEFEKYFARPVLQMILQQPIVASNRAGQFDIVAPLPVVVSPVRPVPFVTAFPRPSPTTNRACARFSRRVAS